MKLSTFEKRMTIFLGHAKRNDATREELDTIIRMIDIVKKYLPCYQKKGEIK